MIGAFATMAQVAEDPAVRERCPLIAEALLAGATPQLRNVATIGGDLMRRTRCDYFRDPGFPACNRRAPGSGCDALDGENRKHAVLGTSDHCIAAHPLRPGGRARRPRRCRPAPGPAWRTDGPRRGLPPAAG